MGIISKSVAHACSGGARGFFKPNDQEYGKAAGVVKFYRDQEKPGRYVSEFKDPARVSCKHAHRAAQVREQSREKDQHSTGNGKMLLQLGIQCNKHRTDCFGATIVRDSKHV